ncbi:acyltransferase family protein [Micromonospora wenchangensis]|uniref:acyltransferase family protein n=1 Tax=Micromonospora wenchangensis TaxID=1185415 RepID=UPI00381567D7
MSHAWWTDDDECLAPGRRRGQGSSGLNAAATGPEDVAVVATGSQPLSQVSESTRVPGIDRLRVALTAGVIATHAVITYTANGSWFYHEGHLPPAVETLAGIPLALGALFGMGTFFFLAGLFLPASIARHGTGALLRERGLRLGLPAAVFTLLVVPAVVWWVAVAESRRSSATAIWQEQLRELDAGPLWFVWVLLLFTAVAVPVLGHLRPATPQPLRLRLLVGCAALVAVTSFVLRIAFRIDSYQLGAAHLWQWGQCVGLFVLGLIAGRQGWRDAVPAKVRRACVATVTLGVVSIIGMLGFFADDLDPFGGGFGWQSAVVAVIEGVTSVSAAVLLATLFSDRPLGRTAATLAGSAYAAYLLQTPILVAVALALRPVPAPTTLKLAMLLPTAVILSFVSGAVLRRIPLLRRVLR